jgi:AmmeMemoRadiSam system protein B
MTKRLARLRSDLDAMPSPAPDQPGLFLRDPYRYSDASIVVPHPLVPSLRFFDGHGTDADLVAAFVRAGAATDQAVTMVAHLIETLSGCGFLQDDAFRRLRDGRRRAFRAAPDRPAVHAGGGYPEDARSLEERLVTWSRSGRPSPGALGGTPGGAGSLRATTVAIAAPHASPHGGPGTYAAAYAALGPEHAQRTFVILGTSHYGEADRFGLTGKDFTTPLGRAVTDREIVEGLQRAAPQAFEDEDYCHAVEHSIEFQVLFLQHRFGPGVRIVPILCGPFRFDARTRQRPEEAAELGRAFDALGELQARRGSELCWVLGVDMAHVGRRYGDLQAAQAHDATMLRVAARDRERLGAIEAGDAASFWATVHEVGDDDLRWCGSAPIYTFLRAVPGLRGQLLDYHQWNIDEASVVSFAALAFGAPPLERSGAGRGEPPPT